MEEGKEVVRRAFVSLHHLIQAICLVFILTFKKVYSVYPNLIDDDESLVLVLVVVDSINIAFFGAPYLTYLDGLTRFALKHALSAEI